MTWRTYATLLWLTSVLFMGATLALAWFVPPWLESRYAVSASVPNPAPKKNLPKKSAALPRPTDDQITSAAAAQLTRMSPPPPPSRPAEAAPSLMPAPPPVVQVPLFPGTLIGTIEDGDPSLSYAILRWPDNRVQLVACGQSLSEQPESPKVDSIAAGTVTLKRGEQSQILQVPQP